MEAPTRILAMDHFGGAALGDVRRSRRLIAVADTVFQRPCGTWPDRFEKPADLKAFYRLMENDQATHAAVLAPHRAQTLERMRREPGVVLTVNDTTELDFSGLAIAELGQIGEGHGRGYECHNSLAVVAASGEVLGLANQILFNRPHVPKKETKAQRRKRASRESQLWIWGSQAIPSAPAGRQWIDVCDCAADITEFLAYEQGQGKQYVVRSQHNRCVVLEKGGITHRGKLHDLARTLPSRGQRTVAVGARNGKPARTTTVNVGWVEVRIVPPRQARGEHGSELLPVWVLRVWEADPPAWVEEPLEWILLTNVPVTTFTDACERLDWYCRRWTIEEYHKALKTGCRVEDQQFTRQEHLQPAIALLSVVATTLLNLRDASRRPDAIRRQATEVLPEAYVNVLHRWRYPGKAIRKWSVHDFYHALARLGGHQNRKHDHPPGWLVLWRGWTKLQMRVDAAANMGLSNSG
jgi:hypothetical protein